MSDSYINENSHARRRPEQVDRKSHQKPLASHNVSNAYTKGSPVQDHTYVTSGSSTSGRNKTYGRPVRDPTALQHTQQGRRTAQNPQKRPQQTRQNPQTRHRNQRGSVSASNRSRGRQETRYGEHNAPTTRAVAPVAESPIRSLIRSWQKEKEIKAAEAEVRWQKDIVRVRGGVDKIMLGIVLLLVALGTVMVFSASYPYALTKGYDVLYYGKRQLVFVALGLFVMFIASVVPYKWYCKRNVVLIAYGAGVLLLLAVLVIGVSEGEARRWIQAGPITIQPSELMKFILIIALAYYMQANQKRLNTIRTPKEKVLYNVIFPGVIIGIACGLVLLEKHLSATLIIGCIGLLVILIGGCDWKWVVPCFTAAGALLGTIFVLLNPYALKRLTTFGDEDADLLAEKFQTNQSLYAIGSGGLFGVGLGESRQKYSYIFAAHNDFIFAIWCEEFGFIGAVCLICLFLAFIWRGYVIASRAPDTFSMLTAFGITTQVGIQAMLNMCVVADIIPNTGIPLPFFSYGGSSLVVLLGEMGVLLSISRQYFMTKDQLREEEARKELGMD